jgi:large subunit ribosomal protein L22
MEVRANAKFIRVAPRKVRLVTNVIKGMNVGDALNQLAFIRKHGAKAVIKLVNSGIANAVNNFELDRNNLYIKTLTVDQGPILYRWMPKAMGRATQIRKKTSHIWLVLDERVPSKAVKSKKDKKAKEEIADVTKDMIKQEPKASKVRVEEKRLTAEDKESKGKEIFDVRMKGKHRNIQHMDQKEKKSKGFLKKIFTRKTGV